MNIFSSVALDSITVKSINIDFDRPSIDLEKVALRLRLQAFFDDASDKDLHLCKLNFSATVTGKLTEDGEEPNFDDAEHEFTIVTSVDYIFRVQDSDAFLSLEEEERSDLCANIVYLDFRRRVMMNASNIGVNSFSMPLSLSVLQKK
ncbi:MAG: hypothetical protein PV362_12010 [Providencia heimbachae]|nr:hypothetical protein [Providencia heimbachae]